MATIKYLLQGKTSQSEIYLRLSLNRKQVYKRKTGLSIDFKHWSTDKGYPKQTVADNKKLTVDLRDLEVKIFKDVNDASTNGKIITSDWLKFRIDLFFERVNQNNKIDLLTDCVQYVIDEAPNMPNGKGSIGLSPNTIKGYTNIKNVINRYSKRNIVKTIEVNKEWIEDFFKWLIKNQKYSHNTAVKKTDILKSALEASKRNNIPVSKTYRDARFKTVNTYDEDTDVITLSFDELDSIEKLDLESDALKNARKWLLLSCYTGQRGTALTTRIKQENFEPHRDSYKIIYKQLKGNKKVVIPVLPVVKEIYENGLPYSVSTQKLNKHFKAICKLAQIDELILGKLRDPKTKRNVKKIRPKYEYIATHTGRRSFATNHFNKLPHQIIMKVTGHTNYNTFLKYIQKNNEDHLDTFLEYYEKEALKNKKKSNLTVVKNAVNQ